METGVTKTKRDLSRNRSRFSDIIRESMGLKNSNAHTFAIAASRQCTNFDTTILKGCHQIFDLVTALISHLD